MVSCLNSPVFHQNLPEAEFRLNLREGCAVMAVFFTSNSSIRITTNQDGKKDKLLVYVPKDCQSTSVRTSANCGTNLELGSWDLLSDYVFPKVQTKSYFQLGESEELQWPRVRTLIWLLRSSTPSEIFAPHHLLHTLSVHYFIRWAVTTVLSNLQQERWMWRHC